MVRSLYTTNADFDNGTLVNINHDDVQDQLQLDNSSKPFSFIWVACSGTGTVVRVDTLSVAILGEYRTAPDSGENYHAPSWTTSQDAKVDL